MPFITQGKTNWRFLLIVVVLVAIAGGGILAYQYWWLPKHEIKSPEIIVKHLSSTASSTEGWQTYQNENWGFSLKYPSDWEAKTLLRNFNKPEDISKEIIAFKDSNGLPIINVYIWTNDSRSNLIDWFNKHSKIAYKNLGIPLPSSANTQVAGFPAIEIEVPQSPQASGCLETWFLAKYGQLVFEFQCNLYDRREAIGSLCKSILSTFKFTNATSQATCIPNWQCGWGPCVNGAQSMTAIDSNNCGLSPTGISIACPALARLCK